MKQIRWFLLIILGFGGAGSIALAQNQGDSCVAVDEALDLSIDCININGTQYQGSLEYTGEKDGLYFWDYTGDARPKSDNYIKPEQCGTIDTLSHIKFPCVKLVDGRVFLAELDPVTTGDIKNRWVLKTLTSTYDLSYTITPTPYVTDAFSTAGNQIVDGLNENILLTASTWWGFEGINEEISGMWDSIGYKKIIDMMHDDVGLNTIRIPFSSEMLHSTYKVVTSNSSLYTHIDSEGNPQGYINSAANPDVKVGMTPLDLLTLVVNYAGSKGMHVILDHHVNQDDTLDGLWYVDVPAGQTTPYTEDAWIKDWQTLADFYSSTAVIGADLTNEPYNAHWGSDNAGIAGAVAGDAKDWHRAATEAGNAVLGINPDWLIFVEGVTTYGGKGYWSGGNLAGVATQPVVLDIPNKVVYSPHDYGPSVFTQPWFDVDTYPNNLPTYYDEMWGFIYKENIAPVWMGEFGTSFVVDTGEGPAFPTSTKDLQYIESIADYMAGDFNLDGTSDLEAGVKPISWSWFSWWTSGTEGVTPNVHPTDTVGIVGPTGNSTSDQVSNGMWTTVNPQVVEYLRF